MASFPDADPHPGNIAVSGAGDLVFYDFGMMCETAKSKDDLLDVFFGIYEKDSNKVDLLLLSDAAACTLSLAPVIFGIVLCINIRSGLSARHRRDNPCAARG